MRQTLPTFKPIVIVGGGLGALAVADALGDAARDAVLLTEAVAPHAGLSLGIARCGPVMQPARLAAGHGVEVVTTLLAACRHNTSRLRALPDLGLQTVDSFRCTADPSEWEEMQRSQSLWDAAGIGVTECEAPRFGAAPPHRFRHAFRHHDDLIVDAVALAKSLLARARARGLTVHEGSRVTGVHEAAEVNVQTSHGAVRGEIVIVATEAELPALVPFCRFKLVPMRVQALAAAADGTAPPGIWSAAHGYETGRVHANGDVWLSGSRDLPVRDELGSRRQTTVAVQALLERELRAWSAFASHRVVRRWAGVQAVSCDGLPLAGPVPGRPRLLILGGFGMDGLGMTLAAADVIAELIRTGRATHAAAFTPRRFS